MIARSFSLGFFRASAALAVMATSAPLQSQTAPDSAVGRRRIQPFPAVGSAPETGLQLGLTVLSVFEPAPRERARPASLVATAIRSFKGQTRLSVEGEHWSRNNDRRVQGLIAWQKFPLPYYGLRADAPESARELYTPTGIELSAGLQQRLRGAWYALGSLRLVDQKIEHDSAGQLRAGTIVGSNGGRVSEATIGVLRDSRDFVFNPTAGTFAQFTVGTSSSAIGSEFDFSRLRLDARQYRRLRGEHVLATHVLLTGITSGRAPFDQLPLVGGGDIMRGYARGRYRDEWLAAAQAEYRSPFVRRLGYVLFAGAGTVADDLSEPDGSRWLPTYGAGLRVQIDARQRTAVRVDYGRGGDGASGLYIGFNQAF
jgi:hypothetical protein